MSDAQTESGGTTALTQQEPQKELQAGRIDRTRLVEDSRRHAKRKRLYCGGALGLTLLALFIFMVHGISPVMSPLITGPLTFWLWGITAFFQQRSAEAAIIQLDAAQAAEQRERAVSAEPPAPLAVTEEQLRSAFRYLRNEDSKMLLRQEIHEVLPLLRDQENRRIRKRKTSIRICLGILLLCVVLGTTPLSFTPQYLALVCLTLVGGFGLVTFLVTGPVAELRQQQTAALALARFDDPRAVGPLAETLSDYDRVITPIVTQALIRLLPRMKASDASLLSSQQRFNLNQALRGRNVSLKLAILKAWEQVGDREAIPEVERLIHAPGEDAATTLVATAARECLPFLQQSFERRQEGEQLLRASDAGSAAPKTLLRPITQQITTEPPDQLLRPTDTI